jgi:hypothetical protein
MTWAVLEKRQRGRAIVKRIDRLAGEGSTRVVALRIWTGVPGTQGKVRERPITASEDVGEVIDAEIQMACDAGFEYATTWSITVRVPTTAACPSRDELVQRNTIGSKLAAEFERLGLGFWDGTDSGFGNWGLFFTHVVVPQTAEQSARIVLRAHELEEVATIEAFESESHPSRCA